MPRRAKRMPSATGVRPRRRQRASGSAKIQELCRLGDRYTRSGEYAEADLVLRKSIRESTGLFGARSLTTCAAQHHYAVLCKYTGHFAEAARIFQQLSRTLFPALGASAFEWATLYHNMGGLEHARNCPARAEPLARKALQIRRRLLGPNDPAVAEDEVALGAILDARHKHRAARRLYLRALRTFSAHPYGRKYDRAVTLNNLAASYYSTGNYGAAERHYRRALKDKKGLFGPQHVDVALTMNNLAILCQAQGKRVQAEQLLNGALTIFNAQLPARHPKRLACQKNHTRLLRACRFTSRAGGLRSLTKSK